MHAQSQSKATAVSLPVNRQIQRDRKWCYAACATMVLHYYGLTSVNQSDIAGYIRKLKRCPAPGDRSGVDAEDIETIYRRWGISSTQLSGLVSFETLKKEISEGRPVQISIRWAAYEESSHVVIAYGWRESRGKKILIVHDPLPDREYEGAVRYGWLQLGCGLGIWEHTWIGIRPAGS